MYTEWHLFCLYSGLRPYSCDVCNKRFTKARSLRRHNCEKSGRKLPFRCNIFISLWVSFSVMHTHKTGLLVIVAVRMLLVILLFDNNSLHYSLNSHLSIIILCFLLSSCSSCTNSSDSLTVKNMFNVNGLYSNESLMHSCLNTGQSLLARLNYWRI